MVGKPNCCFCASSADSSTSPNVGYIFCRLADLVPNGRPTSLPDPLGTWKSKISASRKVNGLCIVGSNPKWRVQKHPAYDGEHEQKHDESKFGNKTTTYTSVTEFTFREMHPCFHRHVYRVYVLYRHTNMDVYCIDGACMCMSHIHIPILISESFHINEMS